MQGENTHVVVKDGAQEIFWKKFQEIQKRELLKVQKQKESELRMKRQGSLERYRESARRLAERWFGWNYNDFNDIAHKKEELVILDKLLFKKTRKKLLAIIGGVAVLGPIFLIADIVAAISLASLMSSALSPQSRSAVLFFAGILGFVALIVGNVFAGVELFECFKRVLSGPEINFLRNRKLALLELREQEKESEGAK